MSENINTSVEVPQGRVTLPEAMDFLGRRFNLSEVDIKNRWDVFRIYEQGDVIFEEMGGNGNNSIRFSVFEAGSDECLLKDAECCLQNGSSVPFSLDIPIGKN